MNFGTVKKNRSSKSDEWTTPRRLVAAIVAEYGPIVLDVAATAANALAPLFFTKKDDALSQDWNCACASAGPGIIWDNPPYSQPNKPLFMDKALATAQAPNGRTVVNVVPCNTRDRWFHRLVLSRLVGADIRRGALGGDWPALVIRGADTDLWLLEGQVSFGSPLNPKGNGSPVGVAVVVFRGRPVMP